MASRRLPLVASIAGALFLVLASGAQAARGPRVKVVTTPAGAEIRVDDPDSAAVATSPTRWVRLPAGSKTLFIRKAGHQPVTVTLSKRSRQRIRRTLTPLSVLDVVAGSPEAVGAALDIDGKPRGKVPSRHDVRPGRHAVTVRAASRDPVTSWVEVKPGQVLRLPVAGGPPVGGTIDVSADVSHAMVLLDDKEMGDAPQQLRGLPAGRHTVEVRSATHGSYRRQVQLEAGETVNVVAALLARKGALRVTTNIQGATVWLDGAPVGTAPVDKAAIATGQHLLEVSASGYDTLQESIQIEPAMRRVLVVRMERDGQTGTGVLVVASATPGTRVWVDGVDRGPAPLTIRDVATGQRGVRLVAAGFETYKTSCQLEAGATCQVEARLFEAGEHGGARAVVRGARQGARLYVDGELAGTLPYDGGVPAGDHRLEVRGAGYPTWSKSVSIQADASPLLLEAPAAQVAGGADPQPGEQRHRFPGSALALGPLEMTASVSAGWVHLLEGRFDIGIIPHVDAGFALRSFGRLTELELRGRASWRLHELVAIGAQLKLGAGVGADANTVFVKAEGLASFIWTPLLATTLVVAFDYTSDHYPFSETDSDVPAAAEGRQDVVALRLGLRTEVALGSRWNLFADVEWAGLASGTRRVLGDLFGNGGA